MHRPWVGRKIDREDGRGLRSEGAERGDLGPVKRFLQGLGPASCSNDQLV